jgi:dienelactone hydrolase
MLRLEEVPMRAILFAALLATSASASAKVVTRSVEYRDGKVTLEGLVALDDAQPGKRPGVLVVHEWTGINPYIKRRIGELAALGYVAFAADIYGKGVRPKNREEAAAQAKLYKSNRALMRARATAGLAALLRQPQVDPRRVAAIGYCFGGTTALELARSGAALAATVSFHGNLDTPSPDDAKRIKGAVLVLHGADDPVVPAKEVLAFQEEMRRARVDYQLVAYGGAVHSFTNPGAGSDPSKGVAYDARADRRSWEAMKAFFAATLAAR